MAAFVPPASAGLTSFEPNIYAGGAQVTKNTTLLTHTAAKYMPALRIAAFNATPALKILGLKAWGKPAALGNNSYGNAEKSSGKGIMFNDGGYQFEFPLFTTTTTGTNVSRMDNITPTFLTPGTGGAYSWVRYLIPLGIPEEFILDNVGNARLMNRLMTDLKIGQMSAAKDMNNIFLGNASAPAGSPYGLPYLVNVNAGTYQVGGITDNATGWGNQSLACTTIGGGDVLDRPLALLRKMQGFDIALNSFAESSNEDRVILGTVGAYQYYLRAVYADTRVNPQLQKTDLADAHIDSAVYGGTAIAYDPAVTVPVGATASTECMYFLDLSELGMCFKSNEYFKLEPWEAPHTKDKQRYYQCNIWNRYVPYTTGRRIQGVIYNMPANTDVVSTNV